MARRRKKARGVTQRSGARRWPAFLAGCVTGAAAAMFFASTDLPRLPPAGGASDSGVRSEEGAEPNPSSKLRYDFYTILPEMEVALPLQEEEEYEASVPLPEIVTPPEPVEVAPETTTVAAVDSVIEETKIPEVPAAPVVESTPAVPPEPAKPVVAAVESGGTYVLQVGSFRREADAERHRARLALLGLEAWVQSIAIDGEAIWHRVQVGPYDKVEALNDARVRLRENDIEAMAMKVRSP